MLKKADDPHIALLQYRASPLQNGYSPAELLVGRKLNTTIPTLSVESLYLMNTVNHTIVKGQHSNKQEELVTKQSNG